jgi:hypothetical protein
LKHSIITLAFISAFATSASAMMITEWMPPPSNIGGIGLGDLLGGSNFGGGGIATQSFSGVTIICGIMCRDQGVVIYHPNGTNKIYVGSSGPAAIAPSTRDVSGRELTAEEQEKEKQKCLASCAAQDTVNKNNCAISNAQFSAKMATMPVWASVGSALIGGILFKGPGAAGGFVGGGMLATFDKDSRVRDQLSMCQAVAARDNNDCITKTCKAWFFAPLLLLRRRREEDKTATV